MGLQELKVGVAVPVSDMAAAREFYEGKLGLSSDGVAESDGGVTYECAEGTNLHIYPSPNAGKTEATIGGWETDDIEGLVDELSAAGVQFEHYDEGTFKTNEKGIAEIAGSRGAWLRDPDGNTLGLINP